MRLNADSIYGCGASAIPVAAFGCRATARGKNLYLHVMEQPVGPLRSQGFRPPPSDPHVCSQPAQRRTS